MDRATGVKFGFLVLVALVVVVFSVLSFFKKDEPENNVFEAGQTTNEDDGFVVEVDVDDLEPNDEEIDDSIEIREDIDDEIDVEMDDPYDMETSEINKFGKEVVNKSKDLAEEFATMLIESETDKNEWEKIATKKVVKNVLEEINSDDENISREVDDLELYVVISDKPDEMSFEIVASWFVANDVEIVNKQEKTFYITTSVKDEKDIKVNGYSAF